MGAEPDPGALQLAAALGHPGACEACSAPALDWSDPGARERALLSGAELWGETLPVLLAADWAEHALPAGAHAEVFAALRRWAEEPEPAHQVALLDAADTLEHPGAGPAPLHSALDAAASLMGDEEDEGEPLEEGDEAFLCAAAASAAAAAALALSATPAEESRWQREVFALYLLGDAETC